MIRIVSTLAIVLLIGSSSWTRPLGLAESIRLATEHSLELKKSRLATQSARSQYEAATARRLPTLALDARGTLVSDVPGLELALPTGQTLSRELGSTEAWLADLSVSLPLYTGGRLSAGVDAGRALVDLNEALLQADLDQVTLQTQITYLLLYRADQLVVASQAALDRARIIRQAVHSMYDAGAADSVDLLESDLTITTARLAFRESETNRREQAISLAILLGLDPAESIIPTDSFVVPSDELPRAAIADTKPQLHAAASTVAMRQAAVRSGKAGYLPTLSLFGGYSFGNPNRDMFDQEFDDYFTVGARAHWSLNLGNETGHQVAAARYDLQSAREEATRVRETLTREAALAYERLLLARDRFDTARDRATVTSQSYRLAVSKHGDGALATNRLLEIEQSLAAAEASRAAAVADYFIARSVYLQAIGTDLTQEGK